MLGGVSAQHAYGKLYIAIYGENKKEMFSRTRADVCARDSAVESKRCGARPLASAVSQHHGTTTVIIGGGSRVRYRLSRAARTNGKRLP